MIEQGGCEPPESHVQDHQELHDLVTSLINEGGSVELYGCWDGDERDTAEHREEISAPRLLDKEFWFRERGLYTITHSEWGRGDPIAQVTPPPPSGSLLPSSTDAAFRGAQ